MMEGPGADSEEKHEPASDIDIALMDSLKVLDPEGPIREGPILLKKSKIEGLRTATRKAALRGAPDCS